MQTQCLLEREGNKQTAWIPSRGAKIGNSVELKEDGQYWNVLACYSQMEDADVKKNERNYLTQKIGSDI